jgi:hypothetical protein
MTLDADSYRVNVPAIQNMLKDKESEAERIEHLSVISVALGVPIIIVCCYYGELFGFSEPLKDMIERLKKFYTVTEVLNVKPTQ